MNFNEEQYRKYRRAAGKQEKDGVFSVTRFPNGRYCFATKQWLGDNGRIDNHPMMNKKFKRITDDKIYTIDSVSIHWSNIGYYYVATLSDEKNSHTVAFIDNINCNNELILEGISKFKKEYILYED